jgi:GH25 family lysozyme M1 (1,4-beta-N-acetylmuramidase)
VLRFIDVSGNNPPTIDWAAEKARGLDGVIVKLTEGAAYVNPYAAGWTSAIRQQGLLVGYYHFALPDRDDPLSEAEHFLSALPGRGSALQPHDLLFLDFEREGNVGAANPSEWALAWLGHVGQAVGQAPAFPGIYADFGYIGRVLTDARLGAYELWAAAWTVGPHVPNNIAPLQSWAPKLPAGSVWSDYMLWQWSASSYNFPSAVIPGAGVDESLSFLTRDQFTGKYGKRAPVVHLHWELDVAMHFRALPDANARQGALLPVGTRVVEVDPPPGYHQGQDGWRYCRTSGDVRGWLLQANMHTYAP